MKSIARLRGLQIDFHGMCACDSRLLYEARGRIDVARSAYAQKQRTALQRVLNSSHGIRHFAEPDNVGTQAAGNAAAITKRIAADVASKTEALATVCAKHGEQFSVHMNEIF